MPDITEEIKEINAKWKPILESFDDLGIPDIADSYRKRVTARLLENTEREYIKENTTTSGVDRVDPILINLVRRTAPNMLAFDVLGVQPMTSPNGAIFAMRAHYGDQPAGPLGVPGDSRTGYQTGGSTQASWAAAGKATNEALYNEADTTFGGTGTQTSNATAVNYDTYSVGHALTTGAGETLGGSGTGDLSWANMSFTIEKAPAEAKTRALMASYTYEVAQDLKAVHGLDAETELSNILSTELLAETNREVINYIRYVGKKAAAENTYSNGTLVLDSNGAAVTGTAGVFDLESNSDGRWSAEKYKSLLVKINKEANAIAKDTRRGRGNFIICSSDVASVLDLTGKLVYSPSIDNNLNVDDTGNTFVGMLQGRFKVYIDPYIGYDEVMIGYKGANQMDAGMFYCPYVPLQMYKAVDNSTMQPKMAFKSRYGIVANPFTTLTRNANSYYRKFQVTNL